MTMIWICEGRVNQQSLYLRKGEYWASTVVGLTQLMHAGLKRRRSDPVLIGIFQL